MNIYAMESMCYMTAGILDSYQNPDAAIEAAIVKVPSAIPEFYQLQVIDNWHNSAANRFAH